MKTEEETMTGVDRIARERRRQIEEEGWTPEHDDGHDDGSLAVAAALLAVDATDAKVEHPDFDVEVMGGPTWMERLAWKHSYRNDVAADKPPSTIRRLEIAGALIAAEIDRLQRDRESG